MLPSKGSVYSSLGGARPIGSVMPPGGGLGGAMPRGGGRGGAMPPGGGRGGSQMTM